MYAVGRAISCPAIKMGWQFVMAGNLSREHPNIISWNNHMYKHTQKACAYDSQ